MLDRAAMERALVAWLAEATGVAVILAEQNGPQPPLPYITVRLRGLRRLGRSAVETRLLPDAPAGEDLSIDYTLQYEITAAAEAFSAMACGAGSAAGLLEAGAGALEREGTRERLREAGGGLAVRVVGAVSDLNALAATRWGGRALLEVVFGVADVVSESGTYIEKFDINDGLL